MCVYYLLDIVQTVVKNPIYYYISLLRESLVISGDGIDLNTC